MSIYKHEMLELRETAVSGRGWYSKSFHPKGTLLLSEFPLVAVPDNAQKFPGIDSGDTYSLVYQILDLNLVETVSDLHCPSVITERISQLPKALVDLAETRRLAPADLLRLVGQVSLNSLGTAFFPERLDFDVYDASQSTGIFGQASFFNHSCTPSAFRYSDAGDLLVVRAARDIQPEEQVTISYIPNEVLLEDAGTRHSFLDGRDFQCLCASRSSYSSDKSDIAELDVCTRAELRMMEADERIDAIQELLLDQSSERMTQDDVYLMTELAKAFRAVGQTEEALACWEEIVEIVDEKYPEFDFFRIVARVEAGRRDEARELAALFYGCDENKFAQLFP